MDVVSPPLLSVFLNGSLCWCAEGWSFQLFTQFKSLCSSCCVGLMLLPEFLSLSPTPLTASYWLISGILDIVLAMWNSVSLRFWRVWKAWLVGFTFVTRCLFLAARLTHACWGNCSVYFSCSLILAEAMVEIIPSQAILSVAQVSDSIFRFLYHSCLLLWSPHGSGHLFIHSISSPWLHLCNLPSFPSAHC